MTPSNRYRAQLIMISRNRVAFLKARLTIVRVKAAA